MSDRLLDKYASRNGTSGIHAALVPGADDGGADDLGSFGFVRGGVHDRAVSLELRQKTGNIMAIGYSWIERMEFDPSEGITLHALGKAIRIKGRNLNSEIRPNVKMFEAMVRQKVYWVLETDEPAAFAGNKTDTVIEKIEW